MSRIWLAINHPRNFYEMLGWAGNTVRHLIISSRFKVRISSLTENQLIIETGHTLSHGLTQSRSLLATIVFSTVTAAASFADLKLCNYVRRGEGTGHSLKFSGQKSKILKNCWLLCAARSPAWFLWSEVRLLLTKWDLQSYCPRLSPASLKSC